MAPALDVTNSCHLHLPILPCAGEPALDVTNSCHLHLPQSCRAPVKTAVNRGKPQLGKWAFYWMREFGGKVKRPVALDER
eukprot:scaffold858_cov138-Isochrysis_galbana.AAC.1